MATGKATRLLQRMGQGDARAAEELAEFLYAELHRIAQRAMNGRRDAPTLQPTALLNEVWLKLIAAEEIEWESQAHFLGTAAKAMRSILVDHVRAREATKRGGLVERVALDEVVPVFEEHAFDLLALEEALEELAAFDPELARIVELRFFGGLSHAQVATVLDTSLRSVERGWRTARAWLRRRLDHEADGAPPTTS